MIYRFKDHVFVLFSLLSGKFHYCQTLGLVLRLRVDFVLPLSQQQEEEEQEQEEQE